MGHQANVEVEKIVVPDHRRRRRDRIELEGLKASIAELGIEQPLRLAECPDGTLELVAGEGRLICARELGLKEVPAYIKPADPMKDVAARVAENFAREDLSLADEAEEIKALMDVGYRPAQIQAITGMSAKRVTARLALVEMPQELRDLYRHGGLAAETVSELKAIHDACPAIAAAIGKAAEKMPELISEYLANNRSALLTKLEEVLSKAGVKEPAPFIAHVRRGSSWWRKIEWSPKRSCPIKLKGEDGKWFKGYWSSFDEYNRPAIVLSDEDLDQAVAVGVAIADSGEYADVWIFDLAWLTDHINDIVLPRNRKAVEDAEASRASERGTTKVSKNLASRDPRELAVKLLGKFTRGLKSQAHQANVDLGFAAIGELGSVELTKEVATFFAYEVLGPPSPRNAYHGNPTRARQIAECCARAFPSWITVDKKTLKSGVVRETPVYLDGEAAEVEMWKYITAAKTPQEILGRVLAVHAVALRMQRECGANGKTPHNHEPRNPAAAKALVKVVGPMIPASLKRLERAKSAYNPHREAEALIAEAKRQQETPAEAPAAAEQKGSLVDLAERASARGAKTPPAEPASAAERKAA